MRGVLFLLIAASAWGAQVRVERHGGGHRLLVNGKPFFIKGAVAASRFELLYESGANAARTSAAASQLDRIHSLGLVALTGLPLGLQRHGFDYSDPAAVETQRRKIRSIVTQFRSHSAVLMWAIGNEPEIHTAPEQRRALWREVNHLAEKIKRLDPDHPVITVIGGQYRQMLHEVAEQVPAIDASDPGGGAVEVTWDVRVDAAGDPRVGGDWEPDQPPIPGSVLEVEGTRARIRLPEKPGNYRMFAYARDGKGSAGTANLPVRVEP